VAQHEAADALAERERAWAERDAALKEGEKIAVAHA